MRRRWRRRRTCRWRRRRRTVRWRGWFPRRRCRRRWFPRRCGGWLSGRYDGGGFRGGYYGGWGGPYVGLGFAAILLWIRIRLPILRRLWLRSLLRLRLRSVRLSVGSGAAANLRLSAGSVSPRPISAAAVSTAAVSNTAATTAADPAAVGSWADSGQQGLYLIAFSDHSIQAATAYKVEGDQIHWITRTGEEKQAPLSSVDVGFSKQINRDRQVDFQIP